MIQLAPSLNGWARAQVEGSALAELLEGCLAALGRGGWEVSCRCTDDRELQELSHRFRQEDRPTDVLAVPAAGDPAGGWVLGDLAISVERAARQAAASGGPPEAELRLLAVHGLLHLCGHDHDTPERAGAMTRATRHLLAAAAAERGEPAPAVPELAGADDGAPAPAGTPRASAAR